MIIQFQVVLCIRKPTYSFWYKLSSISLSALCFSTFNIQFCSNRHLFQQWSNQQVKWMQLLSAQDFTNNSNVYSMRCLWYYQQDNSVFFLLDRKIRYTIPATNLETVELLSDFLSNIPLLFPPAAYCCMQKLRPFSRRYI